MNADSLIAQLVRQGVTPEQYRAAYESYFQEADPQQCAIADSLADRGLSQYRMGNYRKADASFGQARDLCPTSTMIQSIYPAIRNRLNKFGSDN